MRTDVEGRAGEGGSNSSFTYTPGGAVTFYCSIFDCFFVICRRGNALLVKRGFQSEGEVRQFA